MDLEITTLSEVSQRKTNIVSLMASLEAQMVKNLPANAGDAGDVGSIAGSARSPGEEKGNPTQYSCPGNPTDKGAW